MGKDSIPSTKNTYVSLMQFIKTYKYYILLGVATAVLVLLALRNDDVIDWTPHYDSNLKSPYGTFVLRQELTTIFPDADISNQDKSIKQALRDFKTGSVYICITDNYSEDSLWAQELIEFAEEGGTVFLSASSFNDFFLSPLGVKQQYDFNTSSLDSTNLTLTRQPNVDHYFGNHYQLASNRFEINSDGVKKVGYRNEELNFVKYSAGLGSIYLHLDPQGFTNYHLLKHDYKYANECLRLIPHASKHVYWEAYANSAAKYRETSVLHIILARPALQASLYTILVTVLIFIIFKSKREQRIIPIIKPLRNDSVDFANTMGNLYFKNRDDRDLIIKRFRHLKNDIRERFNIASQDIEQFDPVYMSKRTGTPSDLIKEYKDSIQKVLRGGSADLVIKCISLEYKIVNHLDKR